MHTSQSSSMVARTFLATVVVSTMAACDRSGSPLAPTDHGAAPEAAVRIARRPAASHGTPMTREEARKKAIEDARTALALARSGGVTGLSDGRKLTGADAVLFWERTLRALETGSSPLSAWRTAASSSAAATASMATADEQGYVAGSTYLTRSWSRADVFSFTMGSGSASVLIDGSLEVYLVRSNTWYYGSKSIYQPYLAFAYGDEVSGSAEVSWDYNWVAEYAFAMTTHQASYDGYESFTTSSASH